MITWPTGGCCPSFSTGMYFAVSQTSDPTAGTWYLYEFTTSAGLPDYPKIGVWPDAFYMSTYEAPSLGIYAFDRAKMLAGLPAGFVKTTISTLNGTVRDTRILPVDLDGPAPPPGTPGYFVRTVDHQQDTANPTDRIEVYEAIVNWAGPTFSFPLVGTLSPAPFNTMVGNRNGGGVRDIIPQPGTTATLDGLSNRPMMQLKYRNFGAVSKMVLCQTIDISGSIPGLLGFTPAMEVAGIRWYELEKSGANWSIGQQGTFGDQPPGATNENQLLHRWMGSAAMNGNGDIAIGYSITNDDDANRSEPGSWNTAPWLNLFFGGTAIGNDDLLLPVITGTDQVLNLMMGAMVDSSQSYPAAESGSSTHVGTSAGQFPLGVEGLLGCKFQLTMGGPVKYGWVRVVVSNMGPGAIRDWAYEGDDGAGIPAGFTGTALVPEPARAVLLAAGLASLLVQQRRVVRQA